MKNMYLILETTTGYMDGFYGDADITNRALASWKKRRPEEEHTVLIAPEYFHIPEDRLLTDHVYGIDRERQQ